MSGGAVNAPADAGLDWREFFTRFPSGVLVLGSAGVVVHANDAAFRLLGDRLVVEGAERSTCCALFGCRAEGSPLAGGCLSHMALAADRALPEVRVDLEPPAPAPAAWVTASTLAGPDGPIVVQLRPGAPRDRRRRTEPHWLAGPRLEIRTLGGTSVAREGQGVLGGNWLEQRPGQLLKLLVVERRRVMHTSEIAEALWPEAGLSALATVRHYVHILRERLEPQRSPRSRSSFVVARAGGYALDLERISVDADRFQELAEHGLREASADRVEQAVERLEAALSIYSGDFMADEPYAHWALAERDRLRDTAGRSLRALARLRLASGDMEAAAGAMQWLADLEPFDTGVHQQLILLCLRRRRRSEAVRRYNALRSRMRREFGQEPDFVLSDLLAESAA